MKSSITKSFVNQLAALRSKSGGTSLITMHIPSNYQIALVVGKLTKELSIAPNIKDRSVGKNVGTALKLAIGTLRSSRLNVAPANGLILCAGIADGNHITSTETTQLSLV